MRLESDLTEVLVRACEGRLNEVELQWSEDAALTVVMAAKGYPGSYAKGSGERTICCCARSPLFFLRDALPIGPRPHPALFFS